MAKRSWLPRNPNAPNHTDTLPFPSSPVCFSSAASDLTTAQLYAVGHRFLSIKMAEAQSDKIPSLSDVIFSFSFIYLFIHFFPQVPNAPVSFEQTVECQQSICFGSWIYYFLGGFCTRSRLDLRFCALGSDFLGRFWCMSETIRKVGRMWLRTWF